MLFRGKCRFVFQLGLCLLTLLCFCLPASAFQEEEKEKLPSAVEVIERHILAKGGFEVLSSISTWRTVWTRKDGHEFERWRTPGQKYAEWRVGEQVTWAYGCWVANPSADVKSLKGVGWRQSADHVHVQHGLELHGNLVDAVTIDGATRWIERHESIVVKGIEKLDGKECFVLEFTDTNSEIAKRYFDCETYYKVREVKTEHEAGLNVTRNYFDFKEISGIVVPMKQEVVTGSRSDLWEVKEFEHDGEFYIDEFQMPDNVMVLIAKLEAQLQSESEKESEKLADK